MLFQNFKKYKKKTALISESSKKITYEDVNNYYQFIKKKIKKRSLVLLISENSIGLLVNYITLLKNDCIVQLVDSKTDINEIKNLINSYKPSYICSSDNWFKINKLKNSNLKNIFSIYEASTYKTSFNNKSKKYNKSLSILMPTSGSMGSKKYVRISKKNIYENTKSIITYLKLNYKERSITSMPFCYSYMLSVINSHLDCGGSIFVTDETIVQHKFWDSFKKYKITNFNGVPYHYDILLKLGLDKIYNNNLRFLTQAGGKLDNAKAIKVFKFCKKKKTNFLTMYGQTEASPRMSYLQFKYGLKKIGSIGKEIPGGEIFLIDRNNKRINKSNQVGELIYKGDNVSMGYAYNYKDLSKGDLNKKILKTGDLGFFDDEKFYYIVGRKSRIIKLYGNRFNLDDIEQQLLKKNFRVACKNLNDKLFIFSEKKNKKNSLLRNINKIIPLSKININLQYIQKIPRHRNGKIDYKSLNFKYV
jgi:long-chain acyl-CoA synthetase